MRHKLRIHYDNGFSFIDPHLWIWVSDGSTLEREVAPGGRDLFGIYYDVQFNRSSFNFKFKDDRGKNITWEDNAVDRNYHLQLGSEIWTMADRHNVYHVLPAAPLDHIKDYYSRIKHLIPTKNLYLPDTDVSGLCIPSLLGATPLTDGTILFGFFHPRAARVYLVGNFNEWQCPGAPYIRPELFMEMELHRSFYTYPTSGLLELNLLQNREEHSGPHRFNTWAKRLIRLRRDLQSLKIYGYNPASEGKFVWVLGPWMETNKGGVQRVVGWRSHDKSDLQGEIILVMINFEGHAVPVDVDFNLAGRWVKLADIDHINDISTTGLKNLDGGNYISTDGIFPNFILPPYSGFMYQYISSDC